MLLYRPHISYPSYDFVCNYLKHNVSFPILNVSVAANSNVFKSDRHAINHLFGNEKVALNFFDFQ